MILHIFFVEKLSRIQCNCFLRAPVSARSNFYSDTTDEWVHLGALFMASAGPSTASVEGKVTEEINVSLNLCFCNIYYALLLCLGRNSHARNGQRL